MNRSLVLVVVALAVVGVSGAQVPVEPHGGQGASGYIYEGAHWLNEGGLNDAMFRGADSLYGVNDMLFRVFSGNDRRPSHYNRYWWETPYESFYPQTFVYPVAPVVGPTGPLTIVTTMTTPAGTVAELRVYLNGVEHTVALAPRIELTDAPQGGFRYGLHMIVRKPATGEVLRVVSGIGTVIMPLGAQQVELVEAGEQLFLRY